MTDQWLPGVGEKTTETQATFAAGGRLHHLTAGTASQVCIWMNTSQMVLFKSAQFPVFSLYLNKSVKMYNSRYKEFVVCQVLLFGSL